ncbi:hypothetical protein BGZ98_002688 [Dissophora globulifera]|nr:hypothetical protein BGZ98_002688 [Dissophora globulifera]
MIGYTSPATTTANADSPSTGNIPGILNRIPADGEWNPGSSPLVGRAHRAANSHSRQVNGNLSNGTNANVNNSGARNTFSSTSQQHQQRQRQREAGIAQIEEVLSRMTLENYRFTGHKTYDKPPMFNPQELEITREDLMKDFTYFTFHRNKRFYKPMDKMIDYIERDPLVEAFSLLCPPPLPEGTDLSQFEYVKPCSPVQMNHLRLFDRAPRSMPTKYNKAFRQAANYVMGLMTLPEKLSMPTKDSLPNVRFDGSKFAGLDYARQGLKSRKDAHPVALKHAKEVWQALMDGDLIPPHDARLGGKGKLIEKDPFNHGRVDVDETNNISMGRLILMLSHRDLLILGALEQPLTSSYLDEEFPIYIGQSWYHGGAERFVNKMARHKIYHCFDAKKFDAAIDGWLVREALLILRHQFKDGIDPQYDMLWEFVYQSLVEVIICRDDGIRMQKHVGTTSGNCFNTLVQSIITLLLGYTALIYSAEEAVGPVGVIQILQECEIEVLGDDMVMALEEAWMRFTKETLAEVVLDCFNIDWSGRKSFTTTHLMDVTVPNNTNRFKGVQFLGMYFRHQRWGDTPYAPKIVIPYRPFRESYLSLLFPKYGDYSHGHSWLRAIGIYLNAAGNSETQLWLEAYIDFLELVPFTRPECWPPSMEKFVTRDFWDLGTKPPLPERISINEWMRMTCLSRNSEENM